MLGHLNECLQNSINANKQTYLQSEQPLSVLVLGSWKPEWKNNKKGRGNQSLTGLLVTNQGSHTKSSVPIEYPLSFPTHPDRHSKVSEHKQPMLSELSMDRPLLASGTH